MDQKNTIDMGMEFSIQKMDHIMRDIGNMGKRMGRENWCILVVISIKEVLKMI